MLGANKSTPPLETREHPQSVEADAPPVTAWPADQIERRDVPALVPHVRNARKHGPSQIAEIAGLIREWGWTVPILIDEHDGIIAGHGACSPRNNSTSPTFPLLSRAAGATRRSARIDRRQRSDRAQHMEHRAIAR